MLNNPSITRSGYNLAVNIFKCEGLPSAGKNSDCNAFVSVRVLGLTSSTPSIEGNQSPSFNCKLTHPVSLPILNDKILLKIWSQARKDVFIANVPEKPSEIDLFNISKLLNNEGRMQCRWFNLYGTPPAERPGWFGKSTMEMYLEGSAYLG